MREPFDRAGWLAGMPDDFRRAVLDRAMPRQYRAGESLHSEGDESNRMYGVAAGTVRLLLSAVDHGPYCGHLLRPGQWAGDGPTISGAPRPVSLFSSGPSTILILPKAAIAEVIALDPSYWRHFVAGTTLNLALAFGAIADLMLRDHRKRLVATLLRIAGVRSGPVRGDQDLSVEVSQADLAAMSNLARTTVVATLRELEDAGLLRVGYRCITILSATRLRAELAEG